MPQPSEGSVAVAAAQPSGAAELIPDAAVPAAAGTAPATGGPAARTPTPVPASAPVVPASVPAPAPAADAGATAGLVPDADAEAVNSLRAAVMRLSRRLRHQRVDETLSSTEMSVLGILARCGSATPGELARKEHVQPPSMTRIVAMLEAKGLVLLEPHPDDRRQKVVRQTEQAEAMLAASRDKRNAWLTELAGRLDEDEWVLLRAAAPVLEKLARA